MGLDDKIQLLGDKRIRTARGEEKEEWYFSVVDMVAALVEAPNHQAARNYWKVTEERLADEGFEPVTSCSQLKMTAANGKRRLTDIAGTEQLLRIIQSIPSYKAESFERWLVGVGRERIEETIDPELAIDRALETCLKKGYSREWINRRLQTTQMRKEFTGEWGAHGVQKGVEYATLIDETSHVWPRMTTRQYKTLKGLTEESLRGSMATLEPILSVSVEATTTEVSEQKEPVTLSENIETVCAGGKVASDTRKVIEAQTGAPAITSKNATQLSQIVVDMIEGNVAPSGEGMDLQILIPIRLCRIGSGIVL